MAIKDLIKIEKHLLLCNGGSCKRLGAEEMTSAIRLAIGEHGLTDKIHTTKTLCNGRCKDGPIIISMPDGFWFKKMDKEKAVAFVRQFLVGKKLVRENILFVYGADDIYSDEEIARRNQTGDGDYSAFF